MRAPRYSNMAGMSSSIASDWWLALTIGRHSTVHEHAEIFVVLPVFAGLDVCITVEPLDRLFKRRELSQYDSLDALILVRVEHLEWCVRREHLDILGEGRRRDLPIAIEPRSVLHRLADINKIARHGVHLLQDPFCSLQPWETQASFRGLTLLQGERAN